MEAKDIPSIINYDRVKQIILQTSIAAWEQHITESSLERWISNFNGSVLGDEQAERTLAAWLLMNFTYYSISEVRELCRVIYRKYIHNKLSSNDYKTLALSTQEKIRRILKRTVFVPLGNPSESGSFILYHFRTANELSKDIFEQPNNLYKTVSDKTIDDIVFIDDVTLSGTQAKDYINEVYLGNTCVSLLTFFATADSLKRIYKNIPYCKVIYAQFLDDRTKLFSASSFVFSNKDTCYLRNYAYQLCYQYGDYLVQNELSGTAKYMEKYPLGYANGQQMFGFFYNTPDNTLPIFWCDTPRWHSAFHRFYKIDTVEGVEIANEEYW